MHPAPVAETAVSPATNSATTAVGSVEPWRLEFRNGRKLKKRLLFIAVPLLLLEILLALIVFTSDELESPVLFSCFPLVLIYRVFFGAFRSSAVVERQANGDVQLTVSRRLLFVPVGLLDKVTNFAPNSLKEIIVSHDAHYHPLAIFLIFVGLLCGVLPGLILWPIFFQAVSVRYCFLDDLLRERLNPHT